MYVVNTDRISTGDAVFATFGTQIANLSVVLENEARDEESMKTEEFIQNKNLGGEIIAIISLIKDFFQGCRYDLAVQYAEEVGKEILQIKIFSKFTPEETAKKEWTFLEEVVQMIPPEKAEFISIFAEIR